MRRGSVIGPMILIGFGVLFLFRNLWPEIPLVDFISRYWPYLLIVWGGIRLAEVLVWSMTSRPLPRNGVSGGEWMLVFLISVIGATMYTAHNAPSWFPTHNMWKRVVLPMGEPYEYTLAPVEKSCVKNCRIIIESFRGNAKITGSADASTVKASGQETVRSFERAEADNANKQTPLELIAQDGQIIVRTNQDKVSDRVQPNVELDLVVPPGSSVEAHGRYGDFDIQSITGNVDITSDNAGVRLEGIGGNVHVETRASDSIRAVDIKGNVELKGRGDDVELQNIGGLVTANGVYVGEIQLRNLAQPLRWDDPLDSLGFEKLPGQIRVTRGEFSGNNIVGPIRLRARSSDVELSNFTQSLDLTLDRGDIDLKPGKDTPKMEVHTRSGDVTLALMPGSKFDVRATTDRGDLNNEYGEPLREDSSGRGGNIEGSTGGGPQLRLATGRGSITVRKGSAGDTTTFPDVPSVPAPPAPPATPAKPSTPLKVEHE
jgi:Putative adhesin